MSTEIEKKNSKIPPATLIILATAIIILATIGTITLFNNNDNLLTGQVVKETQKTNTNNQETNTETNNKQQTKEPTYNYIQGTTTETQDKTVLNQLNNELKNKLEQGEEVRVIIKTNKKIPNIKIDDKIRTTTQLQKHTKKLDKNQNIENLKNKKLLTGNLKETIELKQETKEYQAIIINKNKAIDLLNNENIISITEDETYNTLTIETINITRINDAQNLGYNGANTKICIIDTGLNHNQAEIPQNKITGKNILDGTTNYADDNGHGTKTTYPIHKATPNSNLIIAKAINENGNGYTSDIIAALEYCQEQETNIISISIGSGTYNGYCDNNQVAQKINELYNTGILTIAATGNNANNTGITSPACASKALPVAASTKEGTITTFTNYNNQVILVAPGQNIQTKDQNGNNIYASGTSMSVPFVTATAAITYNTTNNIEELKNKLIHTGTIINNTNRYFAQINAYNAITNNITNNFTPENIQYTTDNDTNDTYTIQAFACNSGTLSTTCTVSGTNTPSASEVIQGSGNLVVTGSGAILLAGGTFTINMTGNVTIQSGGSISAKGANGATGSSGSPGGSLTIQAANIFNSGTITAMGGTGGTAAQYNSGNNGGSGGSINIISNYLDSQGTITIASGAGSTASIYTFGGQGGSTSGTIKLQLGSGTISGTVSSNGGDGGAISGGDGYGGAGGNGNTINITATNSLNISGTINSNGGLGRNSGNAKNGGNGGNAGAIYIYSTNDNGNMLGTFNSVGGAGGTGTGATGGNGGNGNIVFISVNNTLNILGTVSSSGGDGKDGYTGGNAGSSGAITVKLGGGVISGNISSQGSIPGNSPNGAGKAGGNGNTINISATGDLNITSTSRISVQGGNGGSAHSSYSGGAGGTAGILYLNFNNGNILGTFLSSGGNGGAVSGNTGGNGGHGNTVRITATGILNLTSAISSSAGTAANSYTGGTGGNSGAISINLSSGVISGGISSIGSAAGASSAYDGSAGGDGNTINISATNNLIISGALTSQGGNGNSANAGRPGGAAGVGKAISIILGGGIISGNILSTGGTGGTGGSGGGGTGGSAGNSGAINITATGDLNISSTVSSQGGTGGTPSSGNTGGLGGTSGMLSISLNSGILSGIFKSNGGNGGSGGSTGSGTYGANGGNGNNVIILANNNLNISGSVSSTGGNGANSDNGGTGGSSGAISIRSISGVISGSISSSGSTGGSGANNWGNGATGSNGNIINISATGELNITGTISSRGGSGTNSGAYGTAGNGGNGNTILINLSSGVITGNITTTGGTGGVGSSTQGYGGNGGNGGIINISTINLQSSLTISATSILNSNGATGGNSGEVPGKYGVGGNAGLISLRAGNLTVAGSISSNGANDATSSSSAAAGSRGYAGSGGGINLLSENAILSGTVSSIGGNGHPSTNGNNGGGGNGGNLTVISYSSNNSGMTINVLGGTKGSCSGGSCSGTNGANGTVRFHAGTPYTAPTSSSPATSMTGTTLVVKSLNRTSSPTPFTTLQINISGSTQVYSGSTDSGGVFISNFSNSSSYTFALGGKLVSGSFPIYNSLSFYNISKTCAVNASCSSNTTDWTFCNASSSCVSSGVCYLQNSILAADSCNNGTWINSGLLLDNGESCSANDNCTSNKCVTGPNTATKYCTNSSKVCGQSGGDGYTAGQTVSNDNCQAGGTWACNSGYYKVTNTCTVAGAGYYSTNNSDTRTQCNAGYYGSSTTNSVSTCNGQCNAGYYGSTSGQTTNTCTGQCNAGYYCTAGSTSATQNACGFAKYCTAGSSSATSCPTNSNTTSTTSGTALSSCLGNSGYYNCESGTCNVAGTGYYSATLSNSRSQCDAGYYGSSTTNNVNTCNGQCNAGYYCSAGSSSATANACGSNDYYSNTGASSCTQATPGYYTTGGTSTTRTGQTACGGNEYYCTNGVQNSVSNGHYSTGGTSTTRTGQSQCTSTTYCITGVQYNCPTSFSSATGATSLSQCYYTTGFDGNTTNLGAVENIESVNNFIIQKTGYGTINWNNAINASTANLTNNILFGQNWIYVNTANLHTSFNTSANLTINGQYTNPTILRDNQLCTTCQLISYANNQVLFTVNGFSNYTISNATTTTLTLNITPNTTLPYPTQSTVTCTANNEEVTPLLYKNNIPVSNPDISTLNIGTYNYKCNNTATINYTASNTTNNLNIQNEGALIIINNTNIKIELADNATTNLTNTRITTPKDVYIKDQNTGRIIAKIHVRFNETPGDLDLTGLTIDNNITLKKAVFHRTNYDSRINTSKTLYIPYTDTATGEIYICPGATNLEETTYNCANKVTLHENKTISGMSFTYDTIDGTKYYVVNGITGTGGGEGGPPSLTQGNVTPNTGTTIQSYQFSVNYTDAENDAAQWVKVEIDSTNNYTMSENDVGDTDVTNGKLYIATISGTTIGAGNHNYKFFAADEANITVNTSTYNDLTILKITNKEAAITGATITIGATERIATPAPETQTAIGSQTTEVNLTITTGNTIKWQGYHGSVSGNLSIGIGNNKLYNFGNVPKDQIKTAFATTNNNFDFSNLQAINDTTTLDQINNWTTTDQDSATNTYNTNNTIAQIENVPTVELRGYTQEGTLNKILFKAGLFQDNTSPSTLNNFAFAAKINPNQKDYKNTTNTDYELIVAINNSGQSGTVTYYFYLDIE